MNMKILPAMEMKMARPKSMRKLGHGKVTTADVSVSKAGMAGLMSGGFMATILLPWVRMA
jgi:hypothetical protein